MWAFSIWRGIARGATVPWRTWADLAVTGNGGQIVLACFSEGLQRYGSDGHRLDRLPLEETCRLVAVGFEGLHLLVGGLSKRLLLLDAAGKTLATHELEQSAIALAWDRWGIIPCWRWRTVRS